MQYSSIYDRTFLGRS